MSVTAVLLRSCKIGDQELNKSESVVVGLSKQFSESIPESTTNGHYSFSVDVSQVKYAYLQAVGGTLTIKTNSSSVPDDTITLADGEAILWSLAADGAGKCPFSADVTTLYVTNAGSTASVLDIRVGEDPAL